MEIHYLELVPAKKGSNVNFKEIAMEKYEGKEIFVHAIGYANDSASFKRAGKTLKLLECNEQSLVVKITSESSLQMVSKSLAGFSRELIRIDDRREAEDKKRLFEDCVYNHAVFKSKIILGKEQVVENINEMSDSQALKLCVDLFYGDATKTKEQLAYRKGAIHKIKEILVGYSAGAIE